MRGFQRIPDLHDPEWSRRRLYLPPDAPADDLYRYLAYVIGEAFGRAPRVMFKENRIAFRLGWIRAKFPHAKIVHIYRDKESQWKSNVRRVQEYKRRLDVGQDSVTYNGFNVAAYCEDLQGIFPQLDAKNVGSGFERFCALWELSFAENRRHADISVNYRDLTHDFEATWNRVWTCLGGPSIDVSALQRFVVPPEAQADALPPRSAVRWYARYLADRVARRVARTRLALRMRIRDAEARRALRTEPHGANHPK